MTEAIRVASELRSNNEEFAKKLLKIESKSGELIPFNYNPAQKKLQEVIDKIESEGKPVRIIVLKARQGGISTYVQSQLFRRCSSRSNMTGVTIAHLDEAASNLHNMSQLFHEKMPGEIKFNDGSSFNFKPEKKYDNKKGIEFKNLNSSLRILTAGSREAGRSSTIQALHCSEVAFWNDANVTMTALLNALSNSSNSFAVLESTANGVGGYFYDTWQRAKAGKGSWVPVFIAWWEMDDYRTPLTEEEKKSFVLDKEERRLQAAYGLDLEQLKWRRNTIEDTCGGDLDIFKQEYPSDDQEAFLVSGRPYFEMANLITAKEYVSKGIRGNLQFVNGTYRKTEDGVKVTKDTRVEFVETNSGFVELWGYPKISGAYCIGADVAEGLAQGDFSTGQVLDRDTGQQIAEWHGHMDPDLFGEELVKLAIYFNRAWLGIEVNNHGLTTVKSALRTRYTRLYQRHTNPDRDSVEPTSQYGWKTTSITRPLALDDLARAIREKSIIISGDGLLTECTTFIVNSRGRPEGQTGTHDDRVMAMAICLQVHGHTPLSRPISELEKRRKRKAREKLLEPVVSSVTGY